MMLARQRGGGVAIRSAFAALKRNTKPHISTIANSISTTSNSFKFRHLAIETEKQRSNATLLAQRYYSNSSNITTVGASSPQIFALGPRSFALAGNACFSRTKLQRLIHKRNYATEIKTRDQVVEADKWAVEALYPTLADWEAEFNKVNDGTGAYLKLDRLAQLKGKLGESAANLKEALDIYFSASRQIDKLYTYAHLRHDEDTSNDDHKAANNKATTLNHEFSEKTSFIEPEILSLPQETIDKYLASPELQDYVIHIKKIVHVKDHTLSPELEELLAQVGQALDVSYKAFSAMNNSDLDFGTVTNSKGEKLPLTHATFGLYLRDPDRVLRESAYKQLHKKYGEFKNTFCETLNGVVQKHVFLAKARKYKSCLEMALFPKNIPTEVYTSLIKAVHDNIGALHKYVALRKKLLGVDELHLYDMYVPLVPNVDIKKTYEEAEALTIEAVSYLGKEYQDTLRKGLKQERWVDRYENKGKRSGAYSSGCYDSRPYILMNYTGNLHDVFTLSHECGHSMHSLLSRTHQPYHYSDYSIFVAEVASTFNEDMLRDNLMKQTKSHAEKVFLVNQAIEDIRTTLFRQTMFAEFELKIHELAEKKEPLTPALLRKIFRELNAFYFGPAAVIDEEVEFEWARIPHFYYLFYVYQYATGISAAISLADRVRKGGDKEREDYLSFLKGGCSKYPIDMLKVAGVDMTSPEPVQKAIQRFSELVDELERLTSGNNNNYNDNKQ